MNVYLDKALAPAIAAGMGAGFGAVLLPGTSPVVGAVAGLAKYYFDGLFKEPKNQPSYARHIGKPFVANALFKTLPFAFLMKISHYVANSRIFNSNSFSGFNKHFLSNYAFALLISKDVAKSLKTRIINLINNKADLLTKDKDPQINAVLRAIVGMGIFYGFSLNPLYGLTFGTFSLMVSWIQPIIRKDIIKYKNDKDSHAQIKKCASKILCLGLHYKVGLCVGPIFFKTSGLAAFGAYFLAAESISTITNLIANIVGIKIPKHLK